MSKLLRIINFIKYRALYSFISVERLRAEFYARIPSELLISHEIAWRLRQWSGPLHLYRTLEIWSPQKSAKNAKFFNCLLSFGPIQSLCKGLSSKPDQRAGSTKLAIFGRNLRRWVSVITPELSSKQYYVKDSHYLAFYVTTWLL